MSRALTVVLLVMTLGAGQALASEPPDDADVEAAVEAYREGVELYGTMSFEAAALRFKAAYDLHPDPVYLFNIAMCFQHRQKWRMAATYFERFLEAAPQTTQRARVEALLRTARQAWELQRVTVNVKTEPPGVAVTIRSGGEPIECTTPCQERLDAGKLVVTLTQGEATHQRRRVVGPGDTWDVLVNMAEAADASDVIGFVLVQVNVAGASIMIGDDMVPAGVQTELAAGQHRITVTHPQYETWASDVTIAAGETTFVNAPLDPEQVGRTQRIAGYVTLGVGGAALLTGIGLAASAYVDFTSAEELAASGPFNHGEEMGLDDIKERVTVKSIGADISFGLAAVAVTAGIVLWLTAPEAERPTRLTDDGPLLVVWRF